MNSANLILQKCSDPFRFFCDFEVQIELLLQSRANFAGFIFHESPNPHSSRHLHCNAKSLKCKASSRCNLVHILPTFHLPKMGSGSMPVFWVYLWKSIFIFEKWYHFEVQIELFACGLAHILFVDNLHRSRPGTAQGFVPESVYTW